MFWRKKEAKKSSTLDKLIMGAIIGGAIGSVVGAAVAPKAGKETRKIIKDKSKELIDQGKKFIADHQPEIQAAKQKTDGLFKSLVQRFFKKTTDQRSLKKIPEESAELDSDKKHLTDSR